MSTNDAVFGEAIEGLCDELKDVRRDIKKHSDDLADVNKKLADLQEKLEKGLAELRPKPLLFGSPSVAETVRTEMLALIPKFRADAVAGVIEARQRGKDGLAKQ